MVKNWIGQCTAKRLLALSVIFGLAQAPAISAAIHKQYRLAGTNVGVTITGGGTGPLNVNFSNVSPEVVSVILERAQSGSVLQTTGVDVTVGQLTYNCAPAGPCSKVVLAKPL